jgi:hypothetical protein
MNNRTYQWCTKCNRGNGQWVQAHTTNTHIDDFRPKPRTTGGTPRSGHGKNQSPHGIVRDGKEKDCQAKVSFAQTPPDNDTPPPPYRHKIVPGRCGNSLLPF